MRILLCLLSDQHVPNLLSVHHFRPDRLVLIESEAMQKRKVGDSFLKALQEGGLDYADRCEREPLTHEDSLPEIHRALRAAYGRHASADWIANVTGGTKPMSIGAFQFFNALGEKTVYVNYREPNVIQWMDGTPPEVCGHRPTIAEFLAGYGFASRKPADKVAEAEDRARAWWELARSIAARATPNELLDFADNAERDKVHKSKKGITLEPRHLAPGLLDSVETVRCLAETFELAQAENGLTGKLDKYQVQFLLGGWLEIFLWGLLDRHREPLDIWDVRLGLEPTNLDSEVSNDFDVAFMHRYGLSMVECKTGEQEHDPGGEILYKVEAIIRQFHALHVRTILATTSANILTKDGTIKEAFQNRARAYGCTIAAREQIRSLATTDTPVEALKDTMGL